MDPWGARITGWSARLPRARGDGPATSPARPASDSASPRPRGWTVDQPLLLIPTHGFPAPAGMDPRARVIVQGGGGLPRARGDGPHTPSGSVSMPVASPRPRGWTLADTSDRRGCIGFPAPAGMDHAGCRRSDRRVRLPRARGDGPWEATGCYQNTAASPRPRGWTALPLRPASHVAGFPAPAGMDPWRRERSAGEIGLPRARGDGPFVSPTPNAADMASPRPRGWTAHRHRAAELLDGFPAPAGMDPEGRWCGCGRPWLPRARGDGPAFAQGDRLDGTASPRPRGWTLDVHPLGHDGRGFPAPAGMDPRPGRSSRPRPWLPRARGDGPRRG